MMMMMIWKQKTRTKQYRRCAAVYSLTIFSRCINICSVWRVCVCELVVWMTQFKTCQFYCLCILRKICLNNDNSSLLSCFHFFFHRMAQNRFIFFLFFLFSLFAHIYHTHSGKCCMFHLFCINKKTQCVPETWAQLKELCNNSVEILRLRCSMLDSFMHSSNLLSRWARDEILELD